MRDRLQEHGLGRWGTLVVVFGAVGVLATVDPVTSRFVPRCPFLTLVGLYCPGCGTLRALHSLLHGEIGAAVAFNPLLVTWLAVWPLTAMRPGILHSVPVGRSIVVLVVAFWVLRNVPIAPLRFLAPDGERPPLLQQWAPLSAPLVVGAAPVNHAW